MFFLFCSDCDPATGSFPGNSAGSSSNSSLSTRSLDSPSTSLEHVHPVTSSANSSATWDSDVDVEPDPPDWSQGVTEDVLTRLSTAEKKRQEVINGSSNCQYSYSQTANLSTVLWIVKIKMNKNIVISVFVNYIKIYKINFIGF